MIALWSSKSKSVPSVESFVYLCIFLSVSDDVGLMMRVFRFGFFWSSSGSSPIASLSKSFCALLEWQSLTYRGRGFLLLYLSLESCWKDLTGVLGFLPVDLKCL